MPWSYIQTTEKVHDDIHCREVPKWTVSLCNIWVGALHCRLPRESLAWSDHLKLVRKVRSWPILLNGLSLTLNLFKGAWHCLKIWSPGWDTPGRMRGLIFWWRILSPRLLGMLLAFMMMSWYVMTCMNISKADTLSAIHIRFPLCQYPWVTLTWPPPSSHQRRLQGSSSFMDWGLSSAQVGQDPCCYVTVGMFARRGLGSAKQRHWVVLFWVLSTKSEEDLDSFWWRVVNLQRNKSFSEE